MPPGRILALDVGDRRIGLALADPESRIALPLFTLHRSTLHADLKAIARFIRKREIGTLVVGNPLHADGTPSAQSAKAQAFAQALFAEHPTLTHHLLDERLTTREAHALLDLTGTRRTAAHRLDRKGLIDQVAATLLLEAFLSRHNGPILLPDPESNA